MNTKISVIIPVYNAEKYIEACIDSLIGQSIKECEFIFINDGSIDNSREIIERYKKKDNRIILINQENMGVSIARNKGLEKARGEFVGFVDADDYIEMDMYKNLYNWARDCDVDLVISNLESEIDGLYVLTKYPFLKHTKLDKEYINREILPFFIKSDNLNSACNKLYKNIIIKEKGIKFKEKVALGEDGLFNINFISNISTLVYIDYNGYHYREVIGSATRNLLDKDYFARAIEEYKLQVPDKLTEMLDQEKINQLKSIKLIKNIISYIHIYFQPVREISFIKRYKYIKNMINNKNVIESIPIYYNESLLSMGRYERLIINLIKKRYTLGLYFITTYSRLRNKNVRGN